MRHVERGVCVCVCCNTAGGVGGLLARGAWCVVLRFFDQNPLPIDFPLRGVDVGDPKNGPLIMQAADILNQSPIVNSSTFRNFYAGCVHSSPPYVYVPVVCVVCECVCRVVVVARGWGGGG